jgi:hypothetical protein
MEATYENKPDLIDNIKANNPKLDFSGVQLIYEQDKKAYEDHLKQREELNKQNVLISNPTYN